jgi:hypothetical protein
LAYEINREILTPSAKTYKRKFDRELRHVKLILTHERRRMPVTEWLDLVQQIKECISRNPESFFGDELPADSLVQEALDHVFSGFLEDQKLLANQISMTHKIPRRFRLK